MKIVKYQCNFVSYFRHEKDGWEWSYKLYEKANSQPMDVFIRMKQVEDMYTRVCKIKIVFICIYMYIYIIIIITFR